MSKKPTVLVIHGGGFVAGKPSDTRSTARKLRKQGYRVKQARYTLGKGPKRAYQDVKKLAKELGADAAVGFSAGGHIAARLAAKGKVKKAVAVAPPRKPTWRASKRAIKRDLGMKMPGRLPAEGFNKDSGKLRIVHNTNDPWAPYRGSKKLATRSRKVSLTTLRSKDGNPHVPTGKAAKRTNRVIRRSLRSLKRKAA